MSVRTLAGFFVVLFLSACSGGGGVDTTGGFYTDDTSGSGGGGGADVPSLSAGYVGGVAFDSALYDSNVAVYDFSSGTKGELLTSSESETERLGGTYKKTDSLGGFSLYIKTESKPVLIEISGGSYFEEASGVKVTFSGLSSKKLYAVAYYTEGETLDVSVTLLTTIAAGYAEYLSTQGETSTNSVIASNDEVSRWVGFDILTTKPLNVTRSDNASSTLTDGLKYGFISAGLSQLAATFRARVGNTPHEEYPSISVFPQAYEDVRSDGVLDGVKQSGSITLGDYTFGLDTFRGQLASRILQFTAFDDGFGVRSKTGLGFNDLRDFAVSLSSYDGALFGGVPAADIFATAPVITQFLPEDGRTVSGCWPVSALVSDTYGASLVDYFVDGGFVAGAPSLVWAVPSPYTNQCIVTSNFSNGWHLFEIRVTNILGKVTSVFHNVNIQN